MPPPETLPAGRVPRVSRLMALAIRFEELVRSGEVNDYADLARLGHVTWLRVARIVNPVNLGPDIVMRHLELAGFGAPRDNIQEAILFLPPATSGRDSVREGDLGPIATVADWRKQRSMWEET